MRSAIQDYGHAAAGGREGVGFTFGDQYGSNLSLLNESSDSFGAPVSISSVLLRQEVREDVEEETQLPVGVEEAMDGFSQEERMLSSQELPSAIPPPHTPAEGEEEETVLPTLNLEDSILEIIREPVLFPPYSAQFHQSMKPPVFKKRLHYLRQIQQWYTKNGLEDRIIDFLQRQYQPLFADLGKEDARPIREGEGEIPSLCEINFLQFFVFYINTLVGWFVYLSKQNIVTLDWKFLQNEILKKSVPLGQIAEKLSEGEPLGPQEFYLSYMQEWKQELFEHWHGLSVDNPGLMNIIMAMVENGEEEGMAYYYPALEPGMGIFSCALTGRPVLFRGDPIGGINKKGQQFTQVKRILEHMGGKHTAGNPEDEGNNVMVCCIKDDSDPEKKETMFIINLAGFSEEEKETIHHFLMAAANIGTMEQNIPARFHHIFLSCGFQPTVKENIQRAIEYFWCSEEGLKSMYGFYSEYVVSAFLVSHVCSAFGQSVEKDGTWEAPIHPLFRCPTSDSTEERPAKKRHSKKKSKKDREGDDNSNMLGFASELRQALSSVKNLEREAQKVSLENAGKKHVSAAQKNLSDLKAFCSGVVPESFFI